MAINKIKKTALVRNEKSSNQYTSDGDIVDIYSIDRLNEYFDEYFDIDYDDNLSYLRFNKVENNFCCGITDIGELEIKDGFPQEGFNVIMRTLLSEDRTIQMTTNGKGNNIIFETYIKRSKLFTAVKKFKNPNTRNIITIWVSNNGAL